MRAVVGRRAAKSVADDVDALAAAVLLLPVLLVVDSGLFRTATSPGFSILSSWKCTLALTSNFENSLTSYSPSITGAVKRGQSAKQALLKAVSDLAAERTSAS